MATVKEVMEELEAKADRKRLAGMSKFGMTSAQRLGVSVPDMRKIAKNIGKDHKLALALWKMKIQEARIVAGLIADPHVLTEKQMERWVKDIDSWDVCDQLCMNLFEKSRFAKQKIQQWSQRDEEFVKRAAYALIACLAWHDKAAADDEFLLFFPLLTQGATDERNFVKKAVNWALRNIGKRNRNLNKAAIKLAKDIQKIDSRAARWIAADAIRELQSDAVQKRLNKG